MDRVRDGRALADAIQAADGLVLLAGAALAAEAGVPPRPDRVEWSVYGPRMRHIHACPPGPGHLAARRLQDLGRLDGVVTEGDDVLFDEAGVRDVVALAGTVELSVCPDCGYNEPLGCLLELLPQPRCAACGGALRPDVTARHEPPRPDALARARVVLGTTRLVVVADAASSSSTLRELAESTAAPVVVLGAETPGAILLAATAELRP
jgi:NAD-dependent SIR2 family protein deacetylase